MSVKDEVAATENRRIGLGADFTRLWVGSAISNLGSAVGGVALPLITLETLHAPATSVSVLALLSAGSLLIAAFPVGAFVETRRKRPVLVSADLWRGFFLGAIPALHLLGLLRIEYLCLVAIVNGVANISFAAASQAHLRDLIGDDQFTEANGKLMSTMWLGLFIGPSLAGAVLTVVDPVWLCAIDSITFIIGVVCVLMLRKTEMLPQVEAKSARDRLELVGGGIKFVWRDEKLRPLLVSWAAFAGFAAAFSPVSQIFYLRELNFSASQYGLIMGLPSIGGFAGSWFIRHGSERFGLERVCSVASWVRGGLYLLFPLLVPGVIGVVLACILFGLTLFSTSVANASMGSLRVKRTPFEYNARVAALWSFAGMVAGPVLIACVTPLIQLIGARMVLLIIGVGIALTPLLLPSRTMESD